MHKRIFKNKEAMMRALICSDDTVLDVGFWGQGTTHERIYWPHALLQEQGKRVDGVDLCFDEEYVRVRFPNSQYVLGNAEGFDMGQRYKVIFAGDLIEHLSNPGMFLEISKAHTEPDGRLIVTTPNAFNLFNIAGKMTRSDPVVNYDHTCYFNPPTLSRLLEKNGYEVEHIYFVYTLGELHKESLRKKILNLFYKMSALFTPKYMETMVCVARPKTLDA